MGRRRSFSIEEFASTPRVRSPWVAVEVEGDVRTADERVVSDNGFPSSGNQGQLLP